MADEYGFKQETCYCGTDLSGLKAVATSNRFGTLPQGKCPNCGREMLLDAPKVEPTMPASPPSRATRSRRAEPEPEPEPVVEPEPEPAPE